MSSSPPSQGEVLPPHGGGAAPIPDYEREVDRPNSRERGWNFLATPGTYILLGINIAVFCYMIFRGVSLTSPTPGQLLYFGATNTEFILHGQWYRLLTATFVHVGLLHIATNMWCLWSLGLLGEPLLGPFGLIAVYVIAGILIVLLSNKKLPIPTFELSRLRRSVIQFAVLNLIIGIGANFTSIVRIDNHAHIGGLLSGLALGGTLVPRMTSGRAR